MVSGVSGERATTSGLSFQQAHIWRAAHRESCNIPPFAIKLTGTLHLSVLTKALQEIAVRHEVLRAGFYSVLSQQTQRIWSHVSPEITCVNMTAVRVDRQQDEVRRQIRSDGARPFDLTCPPLMRVCLFKIAENEHVLALTVHHIIADLWSMKLLARELGRLYSAYLRNDNPTLPQLRMSYIDYAIWQEQALQAGFFDQQLPVWERALRDVPELKLPRCTEESGIEGHGGQVASASLSPRLTRAIRQFARQIGGTVFTVLFGAFQIVLQSITRHDDFVVDLLLANRDREDLEPLIGMFAASVPLRSHVASHMEIARVIRQATETCFDVHLLNHMTFTKAAELLSPRCRVRRPEVLFTLQDAPGEAPEFFGLITQTFEATGAALFQGVGVPTPTWHQSWQIWNSKDRFRVVVVYRAQMFGHATIHQMLLMFKSALLAMCGNPKQQLREIRLASRD